MRIFRILLPIFLVLGLTSCVEIIDDIMLNLDGSGTFKYNVNLSSSKVKINSILALDSLDGKKVPSLDEIKNKVNRVRNKLMEEEGVSNVLFEADYENFIFKMTCDFNSIGELQQAIKNVIISESRQKAIPELNHNWLSYNDDELNRSVPEITIKKSKEINKNDRDLLKSGTYTSITRFDREITSYENEKAKLSANKKAIMLRTDPFSLTQNPNLLDNQIYLKKLEE